MRLNYSATDRFFIVFLLTALAFGVFAYFADDRAFWTPIMENIAYLVVASIVVNVLRLWRAHRLFNK